MAESLRCLEDDSSQFTYEEAQNVSDTTDAFKKHKHSNNEWLSHQILTLFRLLPFTDLYR